MVSSSIDAPRTKQVTRKILWRKASIISHVYFGASRHSKVRSRFFLDLTDASCHFGSVVSPVIATKMVTKAYMIINSCIFDIIIGQRYRSFASSRTLTCTTTLSRPHFPTPITSVYSRLATGVTHARLITTPVSLLLCCWHQLRIPRQAGSRYTGARAMWRILTPAQWHARPAASRPTAILHGQQSRYTVINV